MKTVQAHPVPGLVDATGAGDTVASAFALSLLGGAAPIEAAEIANAAGAAVVSKLGASTTRPDEVAAMFAKAGD
jgi:bifunctional ADP-heptose synthase (sugar kinase/adenylyltransferase)